MGELHKHQALMSLPKDKEYYAYGSKTPPISVLLQSAGVEISPMPVQQLTPTPKTPKKRGRKPKVHRSNVSLASAPSNSSAPQQADESLDQVAPQLVVCPSPPQSTNNIRQKRTLDPPPVVSSDPTTPTKRQKPIQQMLPAPVRPCLPCRDRLTKRCRNRAVHASKRNSSDSTRRMRSSLRN